LRLVRRGVGFDVRRAEELLAWADGRAAAIGLGGANFAFAFAGHIWPMPLAQALRARVHKTPFVDGATFKAAVEPRWTSFVEQRVGALKGRTAVLVSALDRYPVFSALAQTGARVLIGDPYFALGLPFLVAEEERFLRFARWTMPILRRIPLAALYPSGRPARRRRLPTGVGRPRLFWGDVHLLRRRLPPLLGATVVVNSLREDDLRLLLEAGAGSVVASPSPCAGLGLPAHAWEALLTARFGALDAAAMGNVWESLGMHPQVLP
jgi:hypothetical protein